MDQNNLVLTNYDVTWNSANPGAIDKVTIGIEFERIAKKTGTTGKATLGHWFAGLTEGSKITVEFRESTLANWRTLMPWAAGSGAADLTPLMGASMEALAQLLVLHPRHLGASTVQDIEFYKTTPSTPYKIDRDGETPDVWAVDFQIYPDPTKLAAGSQSPYGRIKGS